jgi:carbamate kinase
MRVVVALGGNAIAGRDGSVEPEAMHARVREAVAAIADIARSCETVVTHGNGPQVGLLAMQAQTGTPGGVDPQPLDVIGAESEGMIGYMLERELASLFPGSEVATLLTQVEVDADDPAFSHPDKPIGPVLPETRAREWADRLGWRFRAEGGGLRRVVPSPLPRRVREVRTIEILLEAGVIVVTAGGGGVPVVVRPDGRFHGVEAVVDKDRTAALLAEALHADALLLLTDVPGVYADWPEPARDLLRTAPSDLAKRFEFAPGSMGPKVEAACDFVARTGRKAMIGAVDEARRVLQGLAGTCISDAATEVTTWPSPTD